MEQFDWINFYKAFAKTLLKYKENRKTLISNIIEVYKEIEIPLPTLEKDNNIIDIDPFTVFGLFNKSKLKTSNRLKIINGLIKKFNVDADAPNDFDSIPTLNNQNATYYWFIGDRKDDDIIDAKYYSHTTQTYHNVRSLHSANLYQIFTYVKNGSAHKTNVSGMLLYAQTDIDEPLNQEYSMSGNKIYVKTINLNCNFNIIKDQLNEIAELFMRG